MRRTVAGVWDVPLEGTTPALAVTAICFFLGGVAGCVLAASVAGGGIESLSAYVRGFLSASGAGETGGPALLPLIWEVFRWPLFAVVLGFTAVGVIGIPVLFSVRGFFLSFAVSAFVRMFGGTGGLLASLIFGITGAVEIPALFVLGVQGLAASGRLAGHTALDGRRGSPFGKTYFLRCGMCAGAFCVCILLECLAVPALVSWAAKFLPA